MAIFLFVLALASGAPTRAAAAAPTAVAAENCAPIDRAAVTGFFDQWNLSLATLDADAVTARYWPDAVLLTNASSLPRTSPALIHDYFSHFLAQRPRGRIESRSVQVGCNLAIDAGTYTFSVMDESGTVSEFPALYTLVYQYRNGTWKILHHHSSLLAEGSLAPTPTGVIAPAPAPAPAPVPVATSHAKRVPAAAATTNSIATAPGTGSAAKPATAAAAGGFSLHTAPDAATNAAATGGSSAAGGTAGSTNAASATAATAASSKSKAKSRHLAKVENTRESRPDNAGGARSSWSAMFLNQAGTPDVADFYPADAQSRGERGVVSLRVCSDPYGKLAGAPEVLKGSGHEGLDAAAQEWARAARWVPATENGSAVEGCTRVSVQFGS